MSRKISDFFIKKTFKVEPNKGGEEVSNHNFMKPLETEGNCANLDVKLNKNVKIEAEKELLVILPQQKIQKLLIQIKVEENESKIDKFHCNICNKVLRTAMTLKEHKSIHNKQFQCKICDKNYPINARLKEHIRKIHENPGSFKCQICNLKFNTKANLNAHQRVHNPDRPKPFKCGKCDYSIDIKASYQNHLKTHDRIIERCEKCGCILIKNRPHDCRLDCKFCGQKFKQRGAVINHIKKHHVHETGKEFFECDICGLKVKRKMMLQYHMEAKHANGKPQTFTCDLDGKTFKSKEKIVQHMQSHLPPVKCYFCGLKVSVRNLKGHIKNLHTGIKYPNKKWISKPGNFECPICLKVLATRAFLKRHVSSHNKTIKCQFCEKLFGCQMRLNEHFKNYHKNPEGNICKICGKKILRLSNLKTHMMTHDPNRSRNFKCTLCDFAVFEKKNLKNHIKSHKLKDAKIAAIEKLHKCPKCPSSFKAKPNWYAHMYQVHPKALFECDICGIKIKQKPGILKHIQKVHKIGLKSVP